MKILIIGEGGREHAIAWKFSKNKKVSKIYVSKGNAGIEKIKICENVKLESIEEIILFAKNKNVDLAIVGSEEMLVNGIVDEFEKNGLKIFGANKKTAKLEGSKIYSKQFMKKYNIKTAKYEEFINCEKAIKYLELEKYPIVIKADGLAGGKGVVIAKNKEEAVIEIKEMLLNNKFKEAGKKIIIEEFIEGVEVSILSVIDGNNIIPFISAKDHKKIGEGETGLNTGGMGVIVPNPYVTPTIMEDFKKNIIDKTLVGLKKEDMLFKGVVFFGAIINEKGIYLLEYNVRLGDPETQCILPIMESDFLEIIEKAMEGNLKEEHIKWQKKHACCVTAVSKGYPEKYEVGYEIKGLENIDDENIFFAGCTKSKDGKIITNGGRVLNIIGKGDTKEEAIKNSYEIIKKIEFKNMYYRKDIGK